MTGKYLYNLYQNDLLVLIKRLANTGRCNQQSSKSLGLFYHSYQEKRHADLK